MNKFSIFINFHFMRFHRKRKIPLLKGTLFPVQKMAVDKKQEKKPVFKNLSMKVGKDILLIIEGCSMVKQTIWPSNHTSHTKLYFNEFVANVLRDNIGIVIFDL